MTLTKNPLLLALGAIGLLPVLTVVGAFAYTTARDFTLRQQASAIQSVSVPALDDKRQIWAWIGQDQVIASQASTGCFPDPTSPSYYLVNLHTGVSRQLKTLPCNDSAPDSSGIYRSSISSPSPDGKWMLYRETKQGGQRWRLERIDGSATAFIPQTKAFVQPHGSYAVWFPDSQKWIAFDFMTPHVFLYDLANPNAKPRRIAVPFSGFWSPTGEGQLACSRDPHQVVFVSLKDGSTHTVPLVPEQRGKALELDGATVSQDGKWTASLSFDSHHEPVWFVPRPPSVLKLQVNSLVDGSKKEIAANIDLLGPPVRLSPNGKTLLYWGKGGARRVDL